MLRHILLDVAARAAELCKKLESYMGCAVGSSSPRIYILFFKSDTGGESRVKLAVNEFNKRTQQVLNKWYPVPAESMLLPPAAAAEIQELSKQAPRALI
eukprot:6492796-Amphidinium_carterae.3